MNGLQSCNNSFLITEAFVRWVSSQTIQKTSGCILDSLLFHQVFFKLNWLGEFNQMYRRLCCMKVKKRLKITPVHFKAQCQHMLGTFNLLRPLCLYRGAVGAVFLEGPKTGFFRHR